MDTKASSTTLIRRGEGAADAQPLTTPIYETTTFVFDSANDIRRYNENGGTYLYSRYENPTVMAVETKLAAIDGAEGALLFGSGMAATSTVLLALLESGDEVACGAGVYGGTFRLLRDLLPRFGITPRFLAFDQLHDPAQAFTDRTRLFWFESPVNPHLRCVDIRRVAEACRGADVLSVIDNTFASPINQRPLDLGVDLSMQSATKYLNGHSDVTAGVVSGRREIVDRIGAVRRALGGVLDPQPAYALGRGLKTLDVRAQRQNESAGTVAAALEGLPGVARVFYPGLLSHPEHSLAASQMRGFGGMICLELAGGEEAACQAFDRLLLFKRAASLGGVESLCTLPMLTSHWGYTAAQLDAAGVTPGMMRLSIGLEDPADLLADLRRALA